MNEARERTQLHANVSAPKKHWIGAAAGVSWMRFVYVFGQSGPRVELYIDNGVPEENKAVFDTLHAQRAEIEKNVARPIIRERLEAKCASRIRCELPACTLRDETTWSVLRKASDIFAGWVAKVEVPILCVWRARKSYTFVVYIRRP